MPPSKNPSVDYLRVYPGLNDFSDALEAIPQTVVGHLTHLKEIKAKSGTVASETGVDIKSYFNERNPEKLRKISSALNILLPAVGQKMHIAALAAEQVSHQLDRLNANYKMICEHEIPASVQVDEHDPAFIEIVPQEKQASLRSQARREAREAREARRATQQQQESRASTPNNIPETQVNLVSRRRGRTATPQNSAQTMVMENNVGTVNDFNSASSTSERISNDQPPAAHPSNHDSSEMEARSEPELNYQTLPDAGASKNSNTIPPVVMPIAVTRNSSIVDNQAKSENSPPEDSGAEAIIGLKRKRGSAPKSSEPVYCYCQRGSFGEMVGCDGPHCEREWFHLECIGLSALPKGQWFCEECRAKLRRR